MPSIYIKITSSGATSKFRVQRDNIGVKAFYACSQPLALPGVISGEWPGYTQV